MSVYNPINGSIYFTQGYHSGHRGLDIRVKQGSNIYAMMQGLVTASQLDQFGAGWIQVRYADKSLGNYVHLSRLIAKRGDIVQAGQIIGLSGGTKGTYGAGKSTGPHLHYGHIAGGVLVNPMPLFKVAVDKASNTPAPKLPAFDYTLVARDGNVFIQDYNTNQANPNAVYPYKVTRRFAGDRTGTSFVASIEFGNTKRPVTSQKIVANADPIGYEVDIAGIIKTIDLRVFKIHQGNDSIEEPTITENPIGDNTPPIVSIPLVEEPSVIQDEIIEQEVEADELKYILELKEKRQKLLLELMNKSNADKVDFTKIMIGFFKTGGLQSSVSAGLIYLLSNLTALEGDEQALIAIGTFVITLIAYCARFVLSKVK